MFFRRVKPKVTSFSERIEALKQAGFSTEALPDGRVRISKHGVAAGVGDASKNTHEIERAGVLIGGQIAVLVAGGYQEFLELANGRRFPASAEQLRNLHEFEEDLKAALGLTDLYNTALGTTSTKHVYDRVFKRDTGQQPRPWEKKDKTIVAPHTKETVDLSAE